MEMNREVAGGSKPLYSWERWYWGVGVGGVSLFLFWRLKPEGKTPEQIEDERRKAAELEVRRKDHLRNLLAVQQPGGFIAEGDDPLKGMTPDQIEEFMAKEGIDPKDPLEGMSPEEIDEYIRRQEARTSGHGSNTSEGSSGEGSGGSGGEAGSEAGSGDGRGGGTGT